MEFVVIIVLCYIGETKRELTLRLREHHANFWNQKQHPGVVIYSLIGQL